jgi:hypothetical protein
MNLNNKKCKKDIVRSKIILNGFSINTIRTQSNFKFKI